MNYIGNNKVAVPKLFYKVILDYAEPERKAIGFVMENRNLTDDFFQFAVTIDSIENLTGIDFFPNLPDEFENQLESMLNIDLWKQAE